MVQNMKETKTDTISFRVTKTEKEQIRANCQKSGYGSCLSAYMLDKAKDQTVPDSKVKSKLLIHLVHETENLKRDLENADSLEQKKKLTARQAEVNEIWQVL